VAGFKCLASKIGQMQAEHAPHSDGILRLVPVVDAPMHQRGLSEDKAQGLTGFPGGTGALANIASRVIR
jgi:hypothetical protein